MFSSLRTWWKTSTDEAQAAVAEDAYHRYLATEAAMDPPLLALHHQTVAKLLKEFHREHLRIDNLAQPFRMKLAKGYYARSREVAYSNLAENWACLLMALWLETSALLGPTAERVHGEIRDGMAGLLEEFYGAPEVPGPEVHGRN